jgi:hypothetical protein
MKTINNSGMKSEYSPKRIQCTSYYITFAVLMLAMLTTRSAFATYNSVLSEAGINSSNCGYETCCAKFHFVVGNEYAGNPNDGTMNEIEIELKYWNDDPMAEDDCWNWDCFSSNLNLTITAWPYWKDAIAPVVISHTINHTTHKIVIKFDKPLHDSAEFEFILCPNQGMEYCAFAWSSCDWISKLYNPNYPGSGDPYTDDHVHDGGSNISICHDYLGCISCDSTWIGGSDPGTPSCWVDVCFQVAGTDPTGDIIVRFGSPVPFYTDLINPDYPCAGLAPPYGWDTTLYTHGNGANRRVDSIRLKPTTWGHYLRPCNTLCLRLPKNTTVSRLITMDAVDNGFPPCGAPPVVTFKESENNDGLSGVKNSMQNFPNPLKEDNNFNTMIPFVMPATGEAVLSIFDISGKVVHTEVSEFSGSGKHFFFLSGRDLPSGNYYYIIESPKGMVIVKKKMLVIK